MPTRRQRRVAEQIHRELSLLLMFEARDPRLAGVTITGVDISPDLLQAHVHFTVMSEGGELAETGTQEPGSKDLESDVLAGFAHAKGYLRTEIARRIQLRFAPDLAFHIDRSGEYGRRIDELLDRLAEGR